MQEVLAEVAPRLLGLKGRVLGFQVCPLRSCLLSFPSTSVRSPLTNAFAADPDSCSADGQHSRSNTGSFFRKTAFHGRHRRCLFTPSTPPSRFQTDEILCFDTSKHGTSSGFCSAAQPFGQRGPWLSWNVRSQERVLVTLCQQGWGERFR